MCSGSHRTRSEKLSPPDGIGFQVISSDESMRHVDKLTDLYLEVYNEPHRMLTSTQHSC
jgi:hypothetical protein